MINIIKPSRQEMIDAIYEKIANKDLDFWCIVESKWGKSVFLADRNRREIFRTNYRIVDFIRQEEPMKIIGHPVMIGDVMDYFEKIALDKIYDYIWVKKEEIPDLILQKTKDVMMKIFPLWKQKRLPIEEQSDECIDFVYSLISEQWEN